MAPPFGYKSEEWRDGDRCMQLEATPGMQNNARTEAACLAGGREAQKDRNSFAFVSPACLPACNGQVIRTYARALREF